MKKLNSKELRGAILGTLCGDAYVGYNEKMSSARLDIYHKNIFLDYLKEKESVISQIGDIQVKITEKNDSRLLKSGDTRKGFRLQTSFHPYIARLGMMKSEDKFSLLSDMGLAWFWMDDGSLWWKNDGNGFCYSYFAMDSYDDYDTNHFISVLNSRGVNGKFVKYLGKGGKFFNRVNMNKENFLIFREIIRPYIVPSMLYKLLSAKEIDDLNFKR